MKITDTVYTLAQPLDDFLFPEIQPFEESYLKVSDLHSLWYAQYGNPLGMPIIVFHGGPGFGCSPIDMRYFDPTHYRIVLFDQRGGKRSKPRGETQQNSTPDLIEDIEKLRKHLSIQKWFIFGGSWGSALAILYGEAFPQHCLGFILRGVFLARKIEVHHTWYGMQDIYPEAWEQFQTFLPAEERLDLITSYYHRLMNPDSTIHLPATQALVNYILTCSFLLPSHSIIEDFLKNKTLALGIARLFTTYSIKHFFIEDNQLLNNLARIHHLPALIIHGRYDMLCKAKTAYDLHQNWPGSTLTIVQDAGHSALEPGISKALIAATNKMKRFPLALSSNSNG